VAAENVLEYALPRTVLHVRGTAVVRTDPGTGERGRVATTYEIETGLQADPDPRAVRRLVMDDRRMQDQELAFALTADGRVQGDASTRPLVCGTVLAPGTAPAGPRARGVAGERGALGAAEQLYRQQHPVLHARHLRVQQQIQSLRSEQLAMADRVVAGDGDAADRCARLAATVDGLATYDAELAVHAAAYLAGFEDEQTVHVDEVVALDDLPLVRDPLDVQAPPDGSPALRLLRGLGLALVRVTDGGPQPVSSGSGRPAPRSPDDPGLAYRVPHRVGVVLVAEQAPGQWAVERPLELAACGRRSEVRWLPLREGVWGTSSASYAFAPGGALLGLQVRRQQPGGVASAGGSVGPGAPLPGSTVGPATGRTTGHAPQLAAALARLRHAQAEVAADDGVPTRTRAAELARLTAQVELLRDLAP